MERVYRLDLWIPRGSVTGDRKKRVNEFKVEAYTMTENVFKHIIGIH